mmetsp:Transcript_22565/g.25387  ORF Transcript_22565/g.25387 Transcript_22565/m.25387 type:complete len:126 (-) Transcript_22565:1024-1401(-)
MPFISVFQKFSYSSPLNTFSIFPILFSNFPKPPCKQDSHTKKNTTKKDTNKKQERRPQNSKKCSKFWKLLNTPRHHPQHASSFSNMFMVIHTNFINLCVNRYERETAKTVTICEEDMQKKRIIFL